MGSNGSHERIVAVCDGGVVEEGEIERDERSRGAAGGYAGVDF